MSRINQTMSQQCRSNCGKQFMQCRVDDRSAPTATGTGPSTSGAPSPGATKPGVAPPLSELPASAPPMPSAPLTPEELALAVKAVEDAELRRAQFVINGMPVAEPPECAKRGGMMLDPSGCMMARGRARDEASQMVPREALRQFLPAERSLELELATLPQDAIARIQMLQQLAGKYRAVMVRLASLRRGAQPPARPGVNPFLDLAFRFDNKLMESMRVAQGDPEVKKAWLEGRLPDSVMPSDFLLAIEWGADRKTQSLMVGLRRDLKKVALFADRTEDLQQSSRERSDPQGYARWGPPSDNEIGLAVLRVFSRTGGRQTSSIEAERGGPMPALMALLNAPILDVNRIIHVEKAQPCSRSGDAYTCSTKIWLQVFQRGAGMRAFQGAQAQPLVRMLLAAREEAERGNGTPINIVLRPTADGWVAPELTAMVLEADARKTATMDRAAAAHRKAVCETRKQSGDRWAYLDPDCS